MLAGHEAFCLKGHAVAVGLEMSEGEDALANVPGAHTVHVRSPTPDVAFE